MRANEFLTERLPTDAELKIRGWNPDTDDQDRKEWIYGSESEIDNAPGPVGFSAYDAIKSILREFNVTDDEDQLGDGTSIYYVYQTNGSNGALFKPMENSNSGAIELPFNIYSNAAAHIASAVHEAYHAYMHAKVPGGSVYANEKMVNKLAIRWLQKHLTGYNLHIAVEKITHSRISYGDKMDTVRKQ